MKVGESYHRQCGKHSGIPECCVEWYVGSWSNAVMHVPVLWKAYWDYNDNDSIDYIRCPDCIENKRNVELKECNCERTSN